MDPETKNKMEQALLAIYRQGLSEGFEKGYYLAAHVLEKIARAHGASLNFDCVKALRGAFEATQQAVINEGRADTSWNQDLNLESFSYRRRREDGLGVLWVDLSLVGVKQFKAAYTNVRLAQRRYRGKVQAQEVSWAKRAEVMKRIWGG